MPDTDREGRRPRPARWKDMEFVPQQMVGWLDPRQLLGTGLYALLSAVFGSYADRREMQAALAKAKVLTYAGDDDFWLDFVADLGDGFGATYTVAYLLAQQSLAVEGSAQEELPRGRILVMGGDQVYPSPRKREYRDRMYGPYEAALPRVEPPGEPPHLLVLPGNHDWYDGLTGFLRLFTQKRWVGGWRTRQTRSYFAAKLPHRWWLLGVDFQLDAEIDKPQLDFFERKVAREFERGDRIILCTAEPTWLKAGSAWDDVGRTAGSSRRAVAFDKLAFFEKQLLEEWPRDDVRGSLEIPLTLTGDLHHYARYSSTDKEPEERRHRITAGGGGAYTFPTHQLPQEVAVPRGAGFERLELSPTAVFPSRWESWRRAPRVLAFTAFSPTFCALLGALYLVVAWLVGEAAARLGGQFVEQMAASEGLIDAIRRFALLLSRSPSGLVLAAGLVAGFALFSAVERNGFRRIAAGVAGSVHGILHLTAIALLTWSASLLAAAVGWPRGWQTVMLFVFVLAAGGALLGGVLMGAYLLVASVLFGLHHNEVFAVQRMTGFKNFLRMRIAQDGTLTVFPIGIRRTLSRRRWRFDPANADPGSSWLVPKDEKPVARLIEDPIVIGRAGVIPPDGTGGRKLGTAAPVMQ